MSEWRPPRDGEVRQTKFERHADHYVVEYTLYLKPRAYLPTPPQETVKP